MASPSPGPGKGLLKILPHIKKRVKDKPPEILVNGSTSSLPVQNDEMPPPMKRSYSDRGSPESPASCVTSELESDSSSLASSDIPKATPKFLLQSINSIRAKFMDLELRERDRVLEGMLCTDYSPWAQDEREEAKERNRYKDVFAWEHNRVRLNVPQGHCDYINASPIFLNNAEGKGQFNFIATQGPTEDHFSHLWRMVWDETADPAVIVMLTQTEEAGKPKCFQYFPVDENANILEINGHDEFGDGQIFTLKFLESEYNKKARTTIRKLELTLNNKTKTVWHLLFCGWPDFGVPENEDRKALLELIRISAEKNVVPDNPRIIHCSAGVGRSGTFIALEHLLHELHSGVLAKTTGEDDPIFATVDFLREQRIMMVQSEPQYQFLYIVLKEEYAKWRKAAKKNARRIAKANTENQSPEPSHKRVRDAASRWAFISKPKAKSAENLLSNLPKANSYRDES